MQNSISHQFVHMNPSERTFGANINLVKYNIWQNFTDVWFWRHLVHCGRWSESVAKITHQMRNMRKTIYNKTKYNHMTIWPLCNCHTLIQKFKKTRKIHLRLLGQWVELQTKLKSSSSRKIHNHLVNAGDVHWSTHMQKIQDKYKIYGTQSHMVWPWWSAVVVISTR